MLVAALLCATVQADNWPAWRGPTGQGFCAEKNVPIEWSATKNVRWKIPLANQGNSTPVIWGERIFLTQANTGGTQRSLLCFARDDGKLLWEKTVPFMEKEQNWDENWYNNASPVVDGERVVVSFASAGMYCYDFDGKELWKRTDLGHWQHQFGIGSSPVLYNELCILWCGPTNRGEGNYLLAVNKTSGETVWKHQESFGSWSTPLIVNVDGRDQLIVGQSQDVKKQPEDKYGFLKGFDPKTGAELWSCRGLNSYVYTSALYGNGVAVGMSGYSGSALAVKLGSMGDITEHRLWLHPRNTQRVGSGMIIGGHVYIVEENGVPHCYDLKTGDEVWKVKNRPGFGTTWGSMVHAADRLYVLMRNGETQIFKASPNFELIGINSLGGGESTNSSLAISNGDVFIRTFKHLWCIREMK